MLLQTGEKVYVVERKQFEHEVRRHFVGEVESTAEIGFRANGYVFVFESTRAAFVRKPEKRTRIFGYDNQCIINVLPDDVVIDKVKHVQPGSGIFVNDGKSNLIDISEFGSRS